LKATRFVLQLAQPEQVINTVIRLLDMA